MRELLPSPDGSDPGTVVPGFRRHLTAERPVPEGRPWVLANMVMALDGSVSTAGRVGALSSATDQRLFRELRALADVVLVGAATVRAEGYGPHRPDDRQRAERLARGQAPAAAIAVVSASLRLDTTAAFFTQAETRPVVLAPAAAPADALLRLRPCADVVIAGRGSVDLSEALTALHGRGARLVVCEGGPMLLAELLAAGALDELCVTVAPVLVGGPLRLLPDIAAGSTGWAPGGGLLDLRLDSVAEDDGHLFLRYLT